MATISVAMATYNGAKYLKEQLESIAAQSFLPLELIIGDDGSSDATIHIAKNFAAGAPFPVRIHRNENKLGFADNFLTTAERCSGDWIAFCDQDDVWLPHKLSCVAAQIEAYASETLVMVCHVAEVVDFVLNKTGQRLPPIERTHLETTNTRPGFWCMGGCVMVVRGDLVREMDFRQRPPDDWPGAHKPGRNLTLMPHDKWMSLLSNSLGDSLFLADTLSLYRRHATAVSGSKIAASSSEQIASARTIGSDYYLFRADVARQAADALRRIGGALADERTPSLFASAARFDEMNAVLSARARLYQQVGLIARLGSLAVLVRRRAYTGDPVSSLRARSFLKDLAFCLTRRAAEKALPPQT